MNITFNDLSYSVRPSIFSTERKLLLSKISGDFRPGELTAIMGPSGAGKSTLMDILSGYTLTNITGSIKLNGTERDLALFRRSSAYIMQDDNLQALLTVQEAMSVAADLRLDVSSSKKQLVITKILKEIGLDESRRTLSKNLSGGQRKRLAIALELISNPAMMFLDEPTSGLDSLTSHQCFEVMKSLARQGRTIVCTVHQPSPKIFEMIDHLYVIGAGHCVFSGSPENAVSFLDGLGLRCPNYHNPADFMLEVTSGEHGNHLTQLVKSSANGKSREWRKYAVTLTDRIYKPSTNSVDSFRQISTLMRCNVTKLSRDMFLTYARLSVNFIVALLSGFACYGMGASGAHSIYNIGVLSFCEQFLVYQSMNSSLLFFNIELPILRREYFNQWYKLFSYFLANRLADLPIELLATCMFSIIMYYLSGQPYELMRLIYYLLPLVLVTLVAQTIGLVIGTIFRVGVAPMVGTIIATPMVLLGGFFVQVTHANPIFQWLFNFSYYKHARDGLLYAIYGMDRSRLACEVEYCQYAQPRALLKEFQAVDVDYWFSMSVLAALYLALNVISYFVLSMRLKFQFK